MPPSSIPANTGTNARTSQDTKGSAITANTNPINLLPTEILSIIMCEATHAQDSFRETYFYPLTLSLVCKLWHVVARETPAIWSTILVDDRHTFRQVPIRLKRSANIPLVIRIDEVHLYLSIGTEIMKRLAPASERWMTLDIVMWSDLRPYLVHLPNHLPQLSALRLGRNVHHPLQRKVPTLNFCIPCLKILHIVRFPVFWDPSTSVFPNLTHFILSGYSEEFPLGRLLDHLQNSPRLTSLELTNASIEHTTDEEFEYIMLRVIPLPRLAELTIRGCYLNEFCLLTTCLKTPNVKNLTLSVIGHTRSYQTSTLAYRSMRVEFPALESLTIGYVDGIKEIEFVHILRQFPPLLILRLDPRSTSATRFERLEPVQSYFAALFNESALDLLSNLSVLYSGGLSISLLLDGMLNLLDSGRRLPKVVIDRLDIEGIGSDEPDDQRTGALARLGELVVLEEWDEERRPSSWDRMLNERWT